MIEVGEWGSQWSELRKNLYLNDNVDATGLTGLTAFGLVPHWEVGFFLHLWISQTGFKMCGLFYALSSLHESSEMQLLWFQSLSVTEKWQIWWVCSNVSADLNTIKKWEQTYF